MKPMRKEQIPSRRTGTLVLLSALLCLVARDGYGESGGKDRLAGIAARSYELSTVKNILGRSAASQRRAKGRPRVAPVPSFDPRGQERTERYQELIERYSAQHGLDAGLIKAVIYAESGGDPRAVSPKGAAGLMQLMPGTAAAMGLEDAFDPEQNIASGTRYLRTLLDRFRSVELALWAYNAGPQAVEEGRLPPETEAYVPRVLRLRRYFKTRGED